MLLVATHCDVVVHLIRLAVLKLPDQQARAQGGEGTNSKATNVNQPDSVYRNGTRLIFPKELSEQYWLLLMLVLL